MNILFVCLLTFVFSVSTVDADAGADDDYGRSRPGGLIIPWQSLLQGKGLEGWLSTSSSEGWSRVWRRHCRKAGRQTQVPYISG